MAGRRRGLLIVSHGSRLGKANEEMFALIDAIRLRVKPRFEMVESAFLEFGKPTVEEQIEKLANLGAGEITVFPLFLAGGRHVTMDLPRILREVSSRHPDIRINQTIHLGAIDGLKDLIIQEIG